MMNKTVKSEDEWKYQYKPTRTYPHEYVEYYNQKADNFSHDLRLKKKIWFEERLSKI